MMKELTIKFHLEDSEYLTAVRLIAGAVCAIGEKDMDAMEDFKVCVTESAIMLKNCGFETCEMTFSCADGIRCVSKGEGGEVRGADNDLSEALISALVSECEIERDGDKIFALSIKL